MKKEELGELIVASEDAMYHVAKTLLYNDADCADAIQEAIVKAAQQKATEILTSAQSQSREMRTTVTNYCENMLRHTEEQLAKSMTEVKTVRSTLRQSGKKATVRPAAQPQKPE